MKTYALGLSTQTTSLDYWLLFAADEGFDLNQNSNNPNSEWKLTVSSQCSTLITILSA